MGSNELHVISNGILSFREMSAVIKEIQHQIDYFHIREKGKTAKDVFDGIHYLLERGFPLEKLVVNSHIDAAIVSSVKRVQLGYQSIPAAALKNAFPDMHAGCSVHSAVEAKQAILSGADSLLYGHIYSTESKRAKDPRGIRGLAELTEISSLPVIAIGGISPEHVPEIIETGAKGIAVMSGIWKSKNPGRAAEKYRLALEKGDKG